MKITKKKKHWVWHWIPYRCAERAGGSSAFRGRTYLWLNWLWVFPYDEKDR